MQLDCLTLCVYVLFAPNVPAAVPPTQVLSWFELYSQVPWVCLCSYHFMHIQFGVWCFCGLIGSFLHMNSMAAFILCVFHMPLVPQMVKPSA